MAYDKPTVYDWESGYGPHNKNQTLQDELWESMRISPGVVALTDDYARSKGLHLSQRFPWDENYGIYFISGYHKLHCLVCCPPPPSSELMIDKGRKLIKPYRRRSAAGSSPPSAAPTRSITSTTSSTAWTSCARTSSARRTTCRCTPP